MKFFGKKNTFTQGVSERDKQVLILIKQILRYILWQSLFYIENPRLIPKMLVEPVIGFHEKLPL